MKRERNNNGHKEAHVCQSQQTRFRGNRRLVLETVPNLLHVIHSKIIEGDLHYFSVEDWGKTVRGRGIAGCG